MKTVMPGNKSKSSGENEAKPPTVHTLEVLINDVMSRRVEQDVSLTNEGYHALVRLDASYVGGRNYIGLAPYWNENFERILGPATCDERTTAHDALIASKLPLGGTSGLHDIIIQLALAYCRSRRSRLE
jgi:hypothetical protein